MDIIEHNGPTSLSTFLDGLSKNGGEKNWSAVRVKKYFLRPITNEAFLVSISPTLKEVDDVHVGFVDSKRLYVFWKNEKTPVYKQLRALISTTLTQQGASAKPHLIVTPLDLEKQSRFLREALKMSGDAADRLFDQIDEVSLATLAESDIASGEENDAGRPNLSTTSSQIEPFRQLCSEKRYRRRLQLLVVEDQLFSQKLLCEVLRSARVLNNNESPLVDVVDSIAEAWKTFIKKAPDITFVDLGLIDGSGHTLARAIKELDPSSCVVIVTANNYEEELSVARQNNVDGFISKPYNKQQIFASLDRYASNVKLSGRRDKNGRAHQF